MVCLIGSSGSGKSTLLRCLNLLEDIDDGVIRFEGREISDPRSTARACAAGSASSSRPTTSSRTCRCSTTSPSRRARCTAWPARRPRREARELLDRFGLAEHATSHPDRLSGGQQQRVALVRALATKPALLLLDEITAALDPELTAGVLDAVRALADEGTTMVLATHEMAFARDVASTVCFLEKGVILEQGPPEQIFTDPREPRTREFLRRVLPS